MVFQKLQAMIAEQLGLDSDQIKPESRIIKDLHADSLDMVETLMNIEAEWGIEVDDKEAADMVTIQDVVSFIESKTK